VNSDINRARLENFRGDRNLVSTVSNDCGPLIPVVSTPCEIHGADSCECNLFLEDDVECY